ncbi:TIGR03088 family PEP-CTERM/XrtA system glycosyltransferase [Noviherbaspirillum pedocola]|uniref:TIGR03088 family PEP-CTERM/XrtA system glycosyltransferase n=1 Tax=Noviherbaspirillum pedocola TaxID=2801341 RepID=A0A934W6E8_9BURK|nr:TIGR03088 family PEP-CTERM/XrtA system glycosyltransferase [Noviherbaspirillum pedocola]MBK4734278.1 TIGR03088 family PEP-CTERM/XrtA system glycosyltransferase [Noviherbaspirillum pedocola]
MAAKNDTPLVVHLIYRFDFGGLETLVAECINRMPKDQYRHAIVCLTGYTDFASKISRPDVQLIALNKPPGLAPGIHWKLYRLLRQLRPAVLHSYNLAAIEYAFTAAAAGVPVRVHAEHGRDAADPQGLNRKHNMLRRWLVPFIDRYIPVSADLQRWLGQVVGVPTAKTLMIANGVDTERFRPRIEPRDGDEFVIGTVGRIQDVKNHKGLVEAFVLLREMLPQRALRLVIVGNGPLFEPLKQQVADANLQDAVWLAGSRTDIPELMRDFDVFALPSIAEGTPVTILEAMATGLPVVASKVGGIPEVVDEGATGLLVPPSDARSLAEALAVYARDPALAARHGAAGRQRVERSNSIAAMVSGYARLYDALRATKKSMNKA